MPAKKKPADSGHFSISYGTIGALVGVLTIIGILVAGVQHLAMKSDLDMTWQRVVNLQDKVQGLEIQMARYFGTKPSGVSAPDGNQPGNYHPSKLMRSAFQSQDDVKVPGTRRIVVSLEFIKDHQLTPSRGGAYVLLGADGQNYSLDDCMAALIEEHDKSHADSDNVQMQMKMKVTAPRKSKGDQQ